MSTPNSSTDINHTPGIYADGYIVFCLSLRLFVRSYLRHVSGICVKVLRQSFSSDVYLSNYLSESIHMWTIVTLEGWLHDPGPQGPCPQTLGSMPLGGARGQNLGHLKKCCFFSSKFMLIPDQPLIRKHLYLITWYHAGYPRIS